MRLTDAEVRNARPADRPYRLFDGQGLYLEVHPSGGKYWRMKYRYAGKERRLAIGVYPEVGLRAARQVVSQAREQLARGVDPSQAKQEDKRRRRIAAVNTFEAVAREWYGKRVHTWAPTHARDVLRRLERNIFPALGARPVDEIDPPEVLAAIRGIEARGAYDLAHRVLGVCGQVFRYAVATGRCTRDPTPDLRGALTPHKAQHQAAVRPEELPALLEAIGTYDQVGDRQTQLALYLLALTFVRTSELIGATWDEIDLEAGLWVVPAERTKARREHLVPLSRQVVDILRELRLIAAGSHYVLPGRSRDKSISNNTLLYALYRIGYKGRMTGHGFRAVASTILNEHGFRADVIERQLAHCERNEVRGAYNRAEYLRERRQMMQWWADYLDNMVDKKRNKSI